MRIERFRGKLKMVVHLLFVVVLDGVMIIDDHFERVCVCGWRNFDCFGCLHSSPPLQQFVIIGRFSINSRRRVDNN